jgi:hypothetical protein
MSRCSNCQNTVDLNAKHCPNCGRPGPFHDGAVLIPILAVCAVGVLFLLPAEIVIWPFSFGFQNTVEIAFSSIWAWLGSGAFWTGMGYLWWSKYRKQDSTKDNCQNIKVQEPNGNVQGYGSRIRKLKNARLLKYKKGERDRS